MSDVFISYKSEDRSRVRFFVECLTAAGLSVWWDQEILSGVWSKPIDRELKAATWVVAFVSAASAQSDNVFVEARQARLADKLIPVWLDKVTLSHDFEAVTARVQNYFFVEGLPALGDPNLQRFCRACGSKQAVPATTELTEADRVAAWLNAQPPVADLALSLTISTIQNASYASVESAAKLLQDILDPPVEKERGGPMPRPFAMSFRSRRLGAVQAECFRTEHNRLKKIDIERVRFVQPERAEILFDYVWRELDGIQEPLCKWLACLAEQPSAELRQYTGLAVGKLAQQHFALVFGRLIEPLAFDDDPERRETADIALSVAAFDPHVRAAALNILRDWSDDPVGKLKARAAGEFSCGYTGARFPDEVLTLLRRLVHQCKSRADREKLVVIVASSLRRRLERAGQEEDSSLLDLPGLIQGLAEWIDHPEDDEDAFAACLLFLSVATCLPLAAPNVGGPLCLTVLMENDATRDRFVGAFGAALGMSRLYDAASAIVADWIEQEAMSKEPSPGLGILVAALLARARPGRETQRITYVFRRAKARSETVILPNGDAEMK